MIASVSQIKKPTAIDRLKEAWNENPIGVILAVGTVIGAVTKAFDVASSVQSRRAYAKLHNKKK